MPRYFFDFGTRDNVVRDTEGTSLPDLASARQEASETLLAIAKERLPDSGEGELLLTVRLRSGPPLLSLTLTLDIVEG